MKRHSLILAASLALFSVQQARCQDGLVEAGTRVRVRAAGIGAEAGSAEERDSRLMGQLDRISTDSLWIRVGSADGPLLSIDRASIRQLEISSGRKRNPGKGAAWGAGVGLGLGLLAVAALDDCTMGTRDWWFDPCDGNEAVIILGSTVAGAVWGAIIGLLITSERWVTLPSTNLIVSNGRGGIRLALEYRLAF